MEAVNATPVPVPMYAVFNVLTVIELVPIAVIVVMMGLGVSRV